MALRLEQVLTEGLAQLSYLIGDDRSGAAAVIDPRADVEVYLALARRHRLSITHIFETHIHADFVSGSRALAAAARTARVYASVEGGASYGFDHQPLRDRDRFELGGTVLTARFTPGHTPEHMSFEAAERSRPDEPWAVFSGDAVFADSAGRPDLLGAEQAKQLAEQLHETLMGYFLHLDDGVLLYPGHGAGSPCGAGIGSRLVSTIGRERRHNPFLRPRDVAAFTDYALSTAPPEPTYYRRMKKLNAAGPSEMPGPPEVAAMPPRAFSARMEAGDCIVVDMRSMLSFGAAHIPGALNLGGTPEASVWAGWVLDPDVPVLLVADDDASVDRLTALLWRTGYTRYAGYLAGGMKAWMAAGLPLAHVPQVSVHDLAEKRDEAQILDVRAPGEWREGHIPGAQHRFLPTLLKDIAGLDPRRPVVVYCDSGYRASLAASILRRHGLRDVRSVPGSWQAWVSAGLPVQRPG